MPLNLPLPAIIAHRGASAYAPENTLAAFKTAFEQGAEGIELDVHLSADEEVVVIHDSDLGRTTNGSGKVFEYKLAELKQLDAGSWFSEKYIGEKIPTLSEVLAVIGDRSLVNIELKGQGGFHSNLPARVVDLVCKFGLVEQVIFSSFNPWRLRQVGQLLPESKLGLLLPPGFAAGWVRALSKLVVNPWGYHSHHKSISTSFFERANREAHPIVAYTVNDTEELRRLCALRIFGIITDDPVKALALRGENYR